MKRKTHSACDAAPRIPYLGLMAVTLCLLVIREWYPFSHFPMYSRLEDKASVVYITDSADAYIPIRTAFGISSSEVKKQYNRIRGILTKQDGRAYHDTTAAEESEAALTVLKYLDGHRNEKFWKGQPAGQLRLHVLVISLGESGGIEREDRLIAELEVSP
ncbi:MAG: hypothetical protein VCA55_16405 [Verrucomicrobiales bacterium]